MNRTIQRFFATIPGSYERVNRILTLGMDAIWRRAAARIAVKGKRAPYLDACCGTGDMIRELRRHDPDAFIVGLDFSEPMLREAAHRLGTPTGVVAAGDVLSLPFGDETFGVITVSFAMRNISPTRGDLTAALREFHRVLKPGGRFVCVETSQPPNRLVRWGFHLYARFIVGRVGAVISGEVKPYHYLGASMTRFYGGAELSRIIQDAGFARVSARRMMFGTAAVHQAEKE